MKNIMLTRNKTFVLIVLTAVALVFLGYAVFYAPLIKKISAGSRICTALESQVRDARRAVDSEKDMASMPSLILEKDVTPAIDELTQRGKAMGIAFTYIRPGEIVGSKKAPCRTMPIEMEIGAPNEKFMAFIGLLDEMKHGVVTVENFDITRDKEGKARFIAKLTVNMYLSENTDAK